MVKEVAADLMVAAGEGRGFDESEVFTKVGKNAEGCLGLLRGRVGILQNGFLAGPF